jgi:DNA-binding GntR family transcriptional regulator
MRAETEAMERRLPAVKHGPLRGRVMDLLRDAIFSGKFQPGEPLVETQIAREIRVSQATVREALVQLEQSGLVVRVPNRATIVTRFSPKELAERLRIRMALEGMIAVEAAPKMGEPEFRELDRRLAAFYEKAAANDHFLRVQADLEFHRYVWECADNQTLYRILHQVTAPMFAFTCLLRMRGVVTDKPIANPHEAIIEALRRGDEEAIRRAVSEHVRSSYEPFLKLHLAEGCWPRTSAPA